MLKNYCIQINDINYNKLYIFLFVLVNSIKITTNIGTIFLFAMSVALGIIIKLEVVLFFWLLYFGVCLLMFVEETFHIVMLLLLKKEDAIKCLEITSITLLGFRFLGGICVRYEGRFSKSDLLYISIAGPIMSLLTSVTIIVVGLIITLGYYKIKKFVFLQMICSFSPLLSLTPIKYASFQSDGYKIKKIVKENKITIVQIFSIIRYVILGCLKPLKKQL